MPGRDDWATTAYRVRLRDEQDFLRVLIQVERGVVLRFVVQYEAVLDGATYPVVRYDSAHGAAHRDILDRTGRVIDKHWIFNKTYAEVATDAIADIKANWPTYREAFERTT